ncbi:Fibrocystin-L [Liparis tanakae]|uniref:Fibrocystin-L n=1 Tax=Liparis tanakae TaxID=230148 RepID=A0A4Z2FMW2_9TELE|nr:Fibrocystin-L [Liparis tanakae]
MRRAYMGGMPCELLKPDSDELYNLRLDSDSAWWGFMSCRMTGTYVGHHNLTYILDGEFGRSLSEKKVYRVSASGKLSMFQTYAEVTGVSPAAGSVMGGTLLTIRGRHFDQTDRPARVLVGGLPCDVQTVSDDTITCRTAKHEMNNDNTTIYPGGRGLKMEVWTETPKISLSEIMSYDENTTGYWTQWIDSLPHVFVDELDYFSSRSRGFLVPPVSANYTVYLNCDDKWESPFTKDQTEDGVKEYQDITASYDVFNEEQVVTFDSWPSNVAAVKEVQEVTVSSGCASHLCGSTFLSLGYGDAKTGPIPVKASADVVEAALNSLWTIKPDSVTVTKQDDSRGSNYRVTFDSDRGDFKLLYGEVFGSDTNVTVAEITKGISDMKTFTLLWGGIPTKPLAFNATESEVRSSLEDMMKAECPAEVLTNGTDVKYFNDFEIDNAQFDSAQKGTPMKNTAFCGMWSLKNAEVLFKSTYTKVSGDSYGSISLDKYPSLCFAYKGMLKNEVGMKFTYQDSEGQTQKETAKISTLFTKGLKWNYKCMDLESSLQTDYVGSDYALQEFYLYKDGGDFYVDAVHIGKQPTANDENGVSLRRRPPPFESQGGSFKEIVVAKDTSAAPRISYEIKARPVDCAFGFPLLEVGFLQMSNSSEDAAEFWGGAATVNVTRPHRATAPLTGTFDVEIYGGRAEGLSVDISTKDLKYALQGIAGMGEVSVSSVGSCREPRWRVEWLTNPGDQPLIQVEVFINGIISKSSGDCGYEWSEDKTPIVTGISPSEGSDGLGTLLTVTGTGFSSDNTSIFVGKTRCLVEQITGKWKKSSEERRLYGVFVIEWEELINHTLAISATTQVCRLGAASAGAYPVSVSFPSLGDSGGDVFLFTYQLVVSSFAPLSGSVAGGTVLTVTGFGFGENATVTVGGDECVVVDASATELRCRTPPGTAGPQSVAVTMGNTSQTAGSSFTFDEKLTARISGLSPRTTTVIGREVLTVQGSNLGGPEDGGAVFVGGKECETLQWAAATVTCRLPVLPPGTHKVDVRLGDDGNPQIR